jgi:hypothetical protein
VTLYTLAPGEREEPGTPVAELFKHDKHRTYYEKSKAAFPRVVAGQIIEPADGAVPAKLVEVDSVIEATAATLGFPTGGRIGLIALKFSVSDVTRCEPFVELRKALDEHRSRLMDCFSSPAGLDFHHVILLSADQVERIEDSAQGRKEMLQRFVSAATKENRSDEFLTATFPREPNRYKRTAAAVTPGSSLLGGQEPHIDLSLVLSAAQALANLAAVRDINNRATEALAQVGRAGDKRPLAVLQSLAETLSDLELDLGFGVEAQLPIRVRVPILQVEQYYEDLIGSLGVRRAVEGTAAMLSRLSKVLDAKQAGEDARRTKWATTAGAAVSAASALAIPLTLALAFAGANVSQALPRDQARRAYSVLDFGHFAPYYLVIGLMPVVAGVIAAAVMLLRFYRNEKVEAVSEAAPP